MSVLRSRAGIDREPRTAQFLIERLCEIRYRNYSLGKIRALPVVIWVDPRPVAADFCNGAAYMVEMRQGAVGVDGARYSIKPQSGFNRSSVCEHMGRLIE